MYFFLADADADADVRFDSLSLLGKRRDIYRSKILSRYYVKIHFIPFFKKKKEKKKKSVK